MKKTVLVLIALATVGNQAWSQNILEAAPPEKGLPSKTLKPIQHSSPKSLTTLWGAGASVGVADGEFQTTITPSTSGYPFSPTGWTALSIFEDGGLVAPGNAYWTNSASGTSQGAYAASSTPISSPTQSNGSAIFDSDLMDNAGIAGNFGGGSSPTAHRGELISGRIDLTGYTDTALMIRYFTKLRNYSNFKSVSFSTDDGNNWTDISTDVLLGYQATTEVEGWINVVFTDVTAGFSNLTQCRIRFVFEGDYYFQTIDDVSVCVAPKHDLYVGLGDPNYNVVEDYYEQYQITNNKHYPLVELSEKHFIYGANVKNNGSQDVVPADNATFEVRIEQDMSGTWTEVYSEMKPIDSVLIGTSGTPIIDTLDDFSWAQVGDFRAIYKVYSPLDGNNDNDSVFNYFSISPNNYASKVVLDNTQKPEATTSAFPGGSIHTFEFGSVFNFPTAGTETLKIDSITYRYFVPTTYSGNDQIYTRVKVYEWIDGAGANDGYIDDLAEMILVATGLDTLSGLLSNLGSYGSSTRSIEDINLLVPSYAMTDDKFYYVAIGFEDTLNGLTVLGTSTMPAMGINKTYNYGMNFFQSTGTDPVASSGVIIVTDNWSTTLYGVGFGHNYVPSIGVHLSGYCQESIADFDTTSNYLAVTFTDASTPSSTSAPITSWSWDFGDGTTSTLQNPTHTYADSGTYVACLTITDSCGPITTCDTISVDKNYANLSDNWMDNVQMYPVPATDFITIEGIQFDGVFSIEIVDLSGKIIRTINYQGESQVTVDLQNEASGSYILRLSNSTSNISKSLLILK